MNAQHAMSRSLRLPATVRRLLAPALCTVGTAAIVLSGCNPATFVDLENQAPVIALGRPASFRRTGFGATMAAVEGNLSNGEPATRLAVGGGADTATILYDIWNSDDVGTFAISNTACETPAGDCSVGTGSAIAGVAAHGNEGTCIAIGEASTDQVRFKCETSPNEATAVLALQTGIKFGFAVASVPVGSVTATRSVVLVGAPAAMANRGSLFRIAENNSVLELNEVTDTVGVVGPDARLGSTIATASLPDATTLATSFPTVPALSVNTAFVAALSAPGQDRVVLVAIGVDPLDGADIDAQVLACLDGAAGFGQVLTLGDINGDGMPELYIGFGESAFDHPGIVKVFDLADLNTLEAGCADLTNADDVNVTILECPTLDGVDCTDGAFGSSLALGDVNFDGTLDLIAGAPRMTVDNQLSAGGVFVMAGSATGVDTSVAAFMTIANPGTNNRMGASVAALRTHYGIAGVTPRHEVAAGAPGANSAFIFLCSGLGDDSSTTGNRCLELATE